MSELYSSSSGSYENYLSQRQTDVITKEIQKSAMMQSSLALVSSAKINTNLEKMSTGIQAKLNENTYAIVASTNLLKNTFDKGFDTLNNTLDLGFAGISNDLGRMIASMNAGFDNLTKTVDYWGQEICEKLDAIHDIVNNPLLTASRELYRRAIQNTSKKFYEEALEDIKGAIEKNKTDYISWGLLGKLYLFGMSEFSNVVNVEKSIEAFSSACKYITPDIAESDEAKKMASEFYFYLAYANYIMSNEKRITNQNEEVIKYLQQSLDFNTKSYQLSEQMLEALYNYAKANCLLGKNDVALHSVKEIINKDSLYAIKSLSDNDLQPIYSEIEKYLISQRNEMLVELKEITDNFENEYFIDTEHSEYGKNFKNLLQESSSFSNETPYLDVRLYYLNVKDSIKNIERGEIPIDTLYKEIELVPKGTLSYKYRISKDNKKIFLLIEFAKYPDKTKILEEIMQSFGNVEIVNEDFNIIHDEFFYYVFLTLECNNYKCYLRASSNEETNELYNRKQLLEMERISSSSNKYSEPVVITKKWTPEPTVIVTFNFHQSDHSFYSSDGEYIAYYPFEKINIQMERIGILKKDIYLQEQSEKPVVKDVKQEYEELMQEKKDFENFRREQFRKEERRNKIIKITIAAVVILIIIICNLE